MFGSRESFAPLYGAQADGDTLQLAVTKDMVTDAPGIDADGHLGQDENDALYTYCYSGHFGERAQCASDAREDQPGQYGVGGRDTSGPVTDDASTRSEERLHGGTEQVEAGRARLRKYVLTEQVTTTVPVSHEEVRGRAGADHRR